MRACILDNPDETASRPRMVLTVTGGRTGTPATVTLYPDMGL
ncbi:MAG TPA: hypothetical protein VFC44_25830 [Candidatus Saccharimonadales bacterium]|nr:hypothetical protein [Candidatus Saccharimonadales bacterium]